MERMTASAISGILMLLQSVVLFYELELSSLWSLWTIPFVLFCSFAVPSSISYAVVMLAEWMPRSGMRLTFSLVNLIAASISMQLAILAEGAPGALETFFWGYLRANFAVGFGLLDSLYVRPLREFNYGPYFRHARFLFTLALVHMMVITLFYPKMRIWYPVLLFDLVLVCFVLDLFIVVKERIYKLDHEPALTLMEFFEMYPEDGNPR